MARKNTFWGAHDISLEEELRRHDEELKKMGMKERGRKMDSSAIIAAKARMVKLTPEEIRKIVRRRRGLI